MAESDLSTFDLLPAGTIFTADEELERALGYLPSTTDDEDAREVEPLGRGWAFDFESRQFARRGVGVADVRGIENLKVWIEKTLRTARGTYVIYTDDYGMDEPFEMIGQPLSPELIGRYSAQVREALLVHDRIDQVRDFRFSTDATEEILYVSFTVVVDDTEVLVEAIPLGEG